MARRTRPSKPAGWSASRRALGAARDGINRAVSQAGGDLSDVELRRTLARQRAAADPDNPNAYRTAMRYYQRKANGTRAVTPEDRQATAAASRTRAAQRIRESGAPRIRMISDSVQISSSMRQRPFGPGYHTGQGQAVDADALAEAIEREDTWAVIALAYDGGNGVDGYWAGSSRQEINFGSFTDVDIEW